MKFISKLVILMAMPGLVLAQTSVAPSTSAPPPAKAASNSSLTPKVFCLHPNFDFHNVEESGDITHLFRIANQGKATLIINNVSTSCGCTAAVEDKKEIPPGGHGMVKVTYHTKGRPGDANKTITVASNDPVNPNYQLKIHMMVVREIDVQPDKVYMYNVQHGTAQSQTIKITGKPRLPLKILSAQSTNNQVTVTSIVPIHDPATHVNGATIQVDVPSTRPIGTFTDSIKVLTSSKKRPEIDVDVMVDVVGKFTYQPKSVNFSQNQTSPSMVSFNAQNTKDFVIRKVESEKHLVRPYVKKVNYGGGVEQYTLMIAPPKHVPANSDGKDTITITTNDVEQPKVTVDVRVSK